jgi:F0F1-type ATP synthase delta subunit
MFKKSLKVSSNNPLSGKDCSKMKKKLSEIYDSESVEAIFSINKKIISHKISGSTLIVYTND